MKQILDSSLLVLFAGIIYFCTKETTKTQNRL